MKLSSLTRIKLSLVFIALVAAALMWLPSRLQWSAAAQSTIAASERVTRPLDSLKSVPVQEPRNLSKFIRDKDAAIALGKALFWDMQTGSDGVQSCATCHYHAGADSRSFNTLNPGMAGGDNVFQRGGPNYQLKASDFPFHKLADVNTPFSTVVSDTNDVTGSQGVLNATFVSIKLFRRAENTTPALDPVFSVNGVNTLKVTGRNTPSVINAAFNYRNFWDGRAQNEFNGVNPFGNRDMGAYVIRAAVPNMPQQVQLRPNSDPNLDLGLENSSLASQAVGPPDNPTEMAAAGRSFPLLGRKLLTLLPLRQQLVATDDGVLGTMSRYPNPGLNKTYEALIMKAFKPEWWSSTRVIQLNADGSVSFLPLSAWNNSSDRFFQMEYNFSLFWGIAIQMYESTLVANDSPFDQFMDGNRNALTTQQLEGLTIFSGGVANCASCHAGPELTGASIANVQGNFIERMRMGDRGIAAYDTGFYNIGVRPTAEDTGVGAADPFFYPLSFATLFQTYSDPFVIPARQFEGIAASPIRADERVAVMGTFKAPSLRNVELTAPYFHNGGVLKLEDVVNFYNRGGDFSQSNMNNLDPDIEPLALSDYQKAALVAFLKGLTDERVRYNRAPFDHPQLMIPNGPVLDAVGRNGYAVAPKNFLEP
jgi:cytochrome c peroxidase